jgi:anti-sigma regulatory factor (Ser/Thr protein kinase)
VHADWPEIIGPGLRQGHRKSRQGHSSTSVPRNPWNDALLPVIVETCRRKSTNGRHKRRFYRGASQASSSGIRISSADRYRATSRDNLQLTKNTRPGWAIAVNANAGPALGSAWQRVRPGLPRPLDAGSIALVTLPTSPFRARRYTRMFLGSCRGIGEGTTETAELLVSELVTNAVRFASDPGRPPRYSQRADASVISVSLRHFRGSLLIEVYDTDRNPPVLSGPDEFAESGRGLVLVNALSKEWSYFFPPGGGKVIYCVLEIA